MQTKHTAHTDTNMTQPTHTYEPTVQENVDHAEEKKKNVNKPLTLTHPFGTLKL